MNKQFEEIIEEAKKISLTDEEKSHMRDFLTTFMAKNKRKSIFSRIFGN